MSILKFSYYAQVLDANALDGQSEWCNHMYTLPFVLTRWSEYLVVRYDQVVEVFRHHQWNETSQKNVIEGPTRQCVLTTGWTKLAILQVWEAWSTDNWCYISLAVSWQPIPNSREFVSGLPQVLIACLLAHKYSAMVWWHLEMWSSQSKRTPFLSQAPGQFSAASDQLYGAYATWQLSVGAQSVYPTYRLTR